MILGFVRIENGAINTHRDSYLLENLNVVSVRRPLLGAGLIGAAGAMAFGLGFVDLLYPSELITIVVIAASALLIGHQVAQLKLISRETKGTELAGAVWGTAASLQQIRKDIVAELRSLPSSQVAGGRS